MHKFKNILIAVFVIFFSVSLFFITVFNLNITQDFIIEKSLQISKKIELREQEEALLIAKQQAEIIHYTEQSSVYGLNHEEIVNKLKEGGYIIFIRHADRDHSINAETLNVLDHAPLRGINLDDINLKRGYCLTDIGIEESKLLGIAIMNLIPITEVIASNTCRTIETAEFMFNKVDKITDGLLPDGAIINPTFQEYIDDEYLKIFDVYPPPGENVVIVGHSGSLNKIGFNLKIAQSESIVIKHDQSGEFHFVTNLRAKDWFRFDW